MVGRPKSDKKKRRIAQEAHDGLMSRAVLAYQAELKKPSGMPRKGSRTICTDFETLYFNETGKSIKLSHATLGRLAAGGLSRAKASEARAWLEEGEVDVVINFIVEMGNRGFPLSHRRLKEHVDEICRARLGSAFPEDGVGHNWTHRFAEKYSDRIKLSWARPLETKRGRAVNPNNDKAWWDLLKETLTKYDIKEHNTYGVDEVGCQPYGTERERVFGGRKPGPQYQQRTGTRENITVLTTICADGTAPAPAMIFKGSAYQMKWAGNNPANAS